MENISKYQYTRSIRFKLKSIQGEIKLNKSDDSQSSITDVIQLGRVLIKDIQDVLYKKNDKKKEDVDQILKKKNKLELCDIGLVFDRNNKGKDKTKDKGIS